jgi:hypothetical protein
MTPTLAGYVTTVEVGPFNRLGLPPGSLISLKNSIPWPLDFALPG